MCAFYRQSFKIFLRSNFRFLFTHLLSYTMPVLDQAPDPWNRVSYLFKRWLTCLFCRWWSSLTRDTWLSLFCLVVGDSPELPEPWYCSYAWMFQILANFFGHFSVQCRKVTHECYTRMLHINVEINMAGGILITQKNSKLHFRCRGLLVTVLH